MFVNSNAVVELREASEEPKSKCMGGGTKDQRRREATGRKNRLLATWRRAVRCAAGSGDQDNVAAPLVKIVGPCKWQRSCSAATMALGKVCSLSSESQVKTD